MNWSVSHYNFNVVPFSDIILRHVILANSKQTAPPNNMFVVFLLILLVKTDWFVFVVCHRLLLLLLCVNLTDVHILT